MPADWKIGDFVCLEGREDWGCGQVQSVIGDRVTVNFHHAGKQLVHLGKAVLKEATGTGEHGTEEATGGKT